MVDDFKQFGFEYEYGGKTWSFIVMAHTREEAEARAKAMSSGVCVGELIEVGDQLV